MVLTGATATRTDLRTASAALCWSTHGTLSAVIGRAVVVAVDGPAAGAVDEVADGAVPSRRQPASPGSPIWKAAV